jgi:hypothetical protein
MPSETEQFIRRAYQIAEDKDVDGSLRARFVGAPASHDRNQCPARTSSVPSTETGGNQT